MLSPFLPSNVPWCQAINNKIQLSSEYRSNISYNNRSSLIQAKNTLHTYIYNIGYGYSMNMYIYVLYLHISNPMQWDKCSSNPPISMLRITKFISNILLHNEVYLYTSYELCSQIKEKEFIKCLCEKLCRMKH